MDAFGKPGLAPSWCSSGVRLAAKTLAGPRSLEFTRRVGDTREGLDHSITLEPTP